MYIKYILHMDTLTVTLGKGEVLLERLLEDGAAVAHECGGKLACSTCQVRVQEGMPHLSPASEDELDMLERASADEPGARLACQAVGADGGEVVVVLSERKLPGRTAGASPVCVSARAARHLSAQLAKQPGAVAVRLAVEPAGCSGFGYRMDCISDLGKDDAVFDTGGLRIAVDPLSLPYVQGTTIDLVQEGLARRLRFDNPNVRQSCGCGESFGV